MQTNHFLKTLLSCIVLCMVVQKASGTFCSAYCSYYNLGAAYTPMCTDQTSLTCTKCDESLFTLTAGQCVPHGKFNETLQKTDLTSLSAFTDWYSTNNLYHINTVGGLYQTIEFYQDPSIPAGGDDLFYKVFTNLPAHFTVKLRFFVIRSAPSTMQFSYYLDNQKFNYNYNQYPSNMTLGDIVTSDKISHQNANLTVGFQAKFAAGVTQYIGIKEVLIFVSKCSLYCQFCSSSTNCVKCGVAGMGDNTYLYNGQCYTECPQQTYAQDLTRTCQPCQTECQNCVGSATNCTQCKFQGKHETFLLNNSCFYSCPDGYFKDFDTNQCICPVNGYFINVTTNKCEPCASECNSCFGSSKIQCYNCSVGNFLIFGTSWCSTTCPSGQYGNELAKKCFSCSSTCSECVNSSSQCTACFFKFSTKYLYNSKCLSECPTGYEKNFALRKCVQCPPFYYSFNGDCLIECPQNYIANNQTKSCLHITQTNFSLTPQPTGIEVLMKGKSVKFNVEFSQGLSQLSISWLSSQGYYNTKLHISQKSILTSHIKLESQKVFSFTFNLQQQLDESTLIAIDFGTRLKTSQNISYSRVTTDFSLSLYPEMLSQYYTKSQGNYLHVVFIPALLVMIVLLAMRSKQSYEMLIQTVRAFQIMALAVFISYPLQSPIFNLLQGLNYFNLEFFPNVYNWFVPTFKNSLDGQFAGFRFFYGDMDFIRMIGSILVFVAVWIILIVVLKVFFIKNNATLGWLLRIGMDLIEVKILHSFWNSLIFTIINSSQNNIYILWLHLFSYVFMGFTIFRYYKIYQENQSISFTFLWRLTATLLLSIAVYEQMVLLIILTLISVAFGFQQYRSQKPVLASVQSFRFSIAFKLRAFTLSFLPWFSMLGISLLVFYRDQMPVLACQIVVGILGYLMVALNVIVIILLRYYFQMKQNRHVKVNETRNDGERSKRIINKQIMEDNLNHQTTPKHDLQTILSRDEVNTIVTEKQVFIKDQFGADFHIAHKTSVPNMEDSYRQNQTVYQKSNYNGSTLGLVESAIKNQLPKNQQNSRIKPLKKNSQQKNIQSWQSNQNQDESIFEDGPIERKFGQGHQTQAIRKSKSKLTPLQTVNVKNQDETQFQQIQLTKRSNPDDNNPNKPMNSIKLLTDEGFKRFNTVDITQQIDKKDSSEVIYYENMAPKRNLQGTQQLRLRSNVFLRDEQESP